MFGRKFKNLSKAESPDRGYDSFEMRLGDEMRGERATLGKSLLDVQRELRIKASYVAAIENADLSAFDSLSFVAGYVRSYARYLEMDPEIVFARFCEETGFDSFKSLRPLDSEVARRTALGADLRSSPAKVSLIKKKKPEAIDPILGAGNPFANRARPVFAGFEPGALGSLAVLALLVGGIGYGGLSLVREIQRVTVAPVEEAPILQAELDPLAGAGIATPADAPEEAGVETPATDSLARLYRPRALETPVLTARDAPISTIRPGTLGALASTTPATPSTPMPVAADASDGAGPDGIGIAAAVSGALSEAMAGAADVLSEIDPAATPRVLAEEPDAVVIVAVREAWVRVRGADGSSLFEKVLQPGETYEVPLMEVPPTLRTGNSGAVYFSVAGQTYGPVAPGPQVVNADISADLVTEKFAIADLSADDDLARVVAELSTPEPALTGIPAADQPIQ
jgi:hypothetical protein